jgi:hypothetical protein
MQILFKPGKCISRRVITGLLIFSLIMPPSGLLLRPAYADGNDGQRRGSDAERIAEYRKLINKNFTEAITALSNAGPAQRHYFASQYDKINLWESLFLSEGGFVTGDFNFVKLRRELDSGSKAGTYMRALIEELCQRKGITFTSIYKVESKYILEVFNWSVDNNPYLFAMLDDGALKSLLSPEMQQLLEKMFNGKASSAEMKYLNRGLLEAAFAQGINRKKTLFIEKEVMAILADLEKQFAPVLKYDRAIEKQIALARGSAMVELPPDCFHSWGNYRLLEVLAVFPISIIRP